MNDIFEDLVAPFGAILAGVAILVAAILFVAERAAFISESVRIEQLRADAKMVDAKMAEDVAGQVAVVNQKIVSKKRWRKTPIGFFIPAGWESVELIEMPKTP